MTDKYIGIGDPSELYNRFKDEFFEFIVKKIADDEEATILIQAYQDYKFELVRNIIDDKVTDYADIMLINASLHVVDEVDTLAYNSWKELNDMYMNFYDKYYELLELNIQ